MGVPGGSAPQVIQPQAKSMGVPGGSAPRVKRPQAKSMGVPGGSAPQVIQPKPGAWGSGELGPLGNTAAHREDDPGRRPGKAGSSTRQGRLVDQARPARGRISNCAGPVASRPA